MGVVLLETGEEFGVLEYPLEVLGLQVFRVLQKSIEFFFDGCLL